MHNIDINAILNTVKPWKLSLTIDGIEYPVKRLTSADFKRLSEAAQHDKDANNQFITDMFEGDSKPDVANWSPEYGGAALSAITAYYQQAVIQKNYDAAAKVVAGLLKK